MAIGAGVYDEELSAARASSGAQAGILILFGGVKGNGFACQANIATLARLPQILRDVADQLDADLLFPERDLTIKNQGV